MLEKTKTKIKFILIALISLLFFGVGFNSLAEENIIQPLGEVFIKYNKIGWQTYEFYTVTNVNNNESLTYEWNVDNKETFNAARLRYYFPKGSHSVKVKVEDKYGNLQYDTVKLKINFWSLQNNWMWWLLYTLLIIIILYYWLVKIIYLLYRRKLSRQVRHFMDILDEHGWVERAIDNHLKAKGIRQKNKKTKKQ